MSHEVFARCSQCGYRVARSGIQDPALSLRACPTCGRLFTKEEAPGGGRLR